MGGRLKGFFAIIAIILMVNGLPAVLPAKMTAPSSAERATGVITRIIAPTDENLYAIDWDPSKDNALLAGANGTVLDYNTTTGFHGMQQDNNFTFRYVAFRPVNTSSLALLAGANDTDGSSLLMQYNGSVFSLIPTTGYTDIRGIAWSPGGSYALVAAKKGFDGVLLKYKDGALTEVWTDGSRNYWSICWGEDGAFVGGYNFDDQAHPLNIQLFDGSSVTLDVQMPPYLDAFPRSVSWSPTLVSGLCISDSLLDGKLLKFNGTEGANVTDPSIRGNLVSARWAHSRPLALIAGAENPSTGGSDGLLYSYNGSALTLESSGRFNALNDAAWHPGDRYALVAGDNGTVLRYSVPNTPPWCVITSPRLGLVVNGTVDITGTAGDLENDPIVSVQVSIDDGTWNDAVGGANWSSQWDTTVLPDGAHKISARSFDGLDYTIPPVESMVIVSNPNNPPVVSIGQPAEAAVVSGNVTISGSASDPDTGDAVTAVQVAIDNGQWANATGTTSWSYVWATATYNDGPHAIRARSSDGELNSTEAVRNVTLQNGAPNIPPSCTITSPVSGSLVSGDVSIQGTASDAENNIQAVYVRIDSGGWQPASGTTSWSFSWDTRQVTGGGHTVYAHAYDGVQNSSDARITLQVGHPPVCAMTSPTVGAVVSGVVTVQGTATDPDAGDAIIQVRVRIDSGDWATATGTTSWTYKWNTSAGTSGEHVIRAKCSDGMFESNEVSRSVTVEKAPVAVTLASPNEIGEDYIVLQWSKNTDTDFARYEVFISEAEGAALSGLTPRPVPSQSVTIYNYTGLVSRHTYWFRVRVVDNAGLNSVSNEVFGTTLRENQAPIASLTASRYTANVGDTITFSADASYDPDRGDRLVTFQWDFEGRGRFPLDTGTISSQRHEFTKAGKYMVQVRVFDNRGASSITTVNVTISDKGGSGPDPAMMALAVLFVIVVVIAAAFVYYVRRSPPDVESYYEEEVHRPAVKRRQEYWPEDEEQTEPVRKTVKRKRRV